QIADVKVTGVIDGANIDAYTSMSIPVEFDVTPFGSLTLVPAPVEQWQWQSEAVGADQVRGNLLGATIVEVTGQALVANGANGVIEALPTVEIDLGGAIGVGNAPVLTHLPNSSYRSANYPVRSGERVVR
ncbi:MAG: hypothetical protein AAFQ82_08510, partial [Myxococcota bacterium]